MLVEVAGVGVPAGRAAEAAWTVCAEYADPARHLAHPLDRPEDA